MADGNIEKPNLAPEKIEKTISLSEALKALDKPIPESFQADKEALSILTEKPDNINNTDYIASVMHQVTKQAITDQASLKPNIENDQA